MPASDDRAKEPVSPLLAGPYGHPLHPLLVAVPIGAWVCSVVFDLASHLTGPDADLAVGATWLVAIGVVGALASATVGFLDFVLIPAGTPAHRTALLHMSLNLLVTGGFAGDVAWRLHAASGATPAGPLVLSLVCLAGLTVSGWLGGRLAYRYGVRVAADHVQATGFATTGSPAPQPSGWPGTTSKGA
jgi:uncharacterized membrane protein